MEFCVRLANEVILEGINESPNRNFVMSPLSLNCLLNMVASGATGPTLNQLLEFLQYENVADANAESSRMIRLATMNGESENHKFPESAIKDCRSRYSSSQRKRKQPNSGSESSSRARQGPELCLVSGIWMDNLFPMKPSFQQKTKDVYEADARTVDFVLEGEEVRKEVNMWAENQTKGLIKDLIPPGSIGNFTKLILANALYFKGEWRRPFDTSMTKHKDFHLLNGSTVKVPLMTTRGRRYFYASFESFKILKLPYESGQDSKQFSMYIFLPKSNDGLKEMIQNLNSQSMFLKKDLNLRETELFKVRIPKFKFSHGSFEASEIMKRLGLIFPFEPKGDFAEMVDFAYSHEVYVSSILHKSCIEVNEKGTEAAAVSLARMAYKCARPTHPPPPPSTFIADHPFMFMIKEEASGVVFFIGTVLNPLKNE